MNENTCKASSTFGTPTGAQKTNSLREPLSGQRATIAKICEEGTIFISFKATKLKKFIVISILTSLDTLVNKLFA